MVNPWRAWQIRLAVYHALRDFDDLERQYRWVDVRPVDLHTGR